MCINVYQCVATCCEFKDAYCDQAFRGNHCSISSDPTDPSPWLPWRPGRARSWRMWRLTLVDLQDWVPTEAATYLSHQSLRITSQHALKPTATWRPSLESIIGQDKPSFATLVLSLSRMEWVSKNKQTKSSTDRSLVFIADFIWPVKWMLHLSAVCGSPALKMSFFICRQCF